MRTDHLERGRSARRVFDTRPEHSAEAVGNSGVVVLSSASLIWFLETACGDTLADCCDPGEVSIGVDFDLGHLAPSAIGEPVEAVGTVTAVHGNKVDFDVAAYAGGRLVMKGSHRRAIVELRRFLEAAGL